MSKPAVERLLLGAFAYFLESGTTVDGTIVAAETVVSPAAGKPDATPTTNWTALGDVEMAKFSTVEAEEKYLVPSSAGGYDERVEKRVIADLLDLKLHQGNEFTARLMAGTGELTLGTAVAAHSVRDRYVEGWLRVQARKQSGSDLFLLDWWCQMRLKEIPEISDKVQRPVLEFRRLYSTLNSVNFPS